MKIKRAILSLVMLLGAFSAYAQYDPSSFFYRGQQALMDGRYSSAIESFSILSRIDTLACEPYFYRGVAKYNLGDYAGAEKDFDRSISKNTLYTNAYHYRAITKGETGRYEEALKDLETAVDLRPSAIGLYFTRGVIYFMSQQFDNAIKDFNRFIRNEPKESAAYLNRGASYLFLGDTVSAMQDYNTAIDINHFDSDAYVRRARIYALKNIPVAAIEDLNMAVSLDSTNTFAFFNRALMKYETDDVQGAISDLNRVLRDEPGKALTLYNRGLIYAQLHDFQNSLDDFDRVININPNNVLAYFNRAAVFMEMGRYREAVRDYDKSIELYPDFAKAYLNRAYAKNMLGLFRESETDYQTAQKKIGEYQAMTSTEEGQLNFADTTKQYSHLLDLDADFAKKGFDNELLQYRDIDIDLKPLYRFVLHNDKTSEGNLSTIGRRFIHEKVEEFFRDLPVTAKIATDKEFNPGEIQIISNNVAKALASNRSADNLFSKALVETHLNQFNTAMACYEEALEKDPTNAYIYLNKGVLQADMTTFISSMDNSMRVLSLNADTYTNTRVRDNSQRVYDYSASIEDLKAAESFDPDYPYTYYNLGNLYCLSNNMLEAIEQYTKALELYPYIPEAYYNRGLVLIYLQDKEKGCIDISVAGELGITEAYSVIKKYCSDTESK
ncbi:MAG: tetratricopeptide repeat protein [Bacteroidales bacterium]|nr:tetratricopeptide repeat protein [Bacteroidales bacterium]